MNKPSKPLIQMMICSVVGTAILLSALIFIPRELIRKHSFTPLESREKMTLGEIEIDPLITDPPVTDPPVITDPPYVDPPVYRTVKFDDSRIYGEALDYYIADYGGATYFLPDRAATDKLAKLIDNAIADGLVKGVNASDGVFSSDYLVLWSFRRNDTVIGKDGYMTAYPDYETVYYSNDCWKTAVSIIEKCGVPIWSIDYISGEYGISEYFLDPGQQVFAEYESVAERISSADEKGNPKIYMSTASPNIIEYYWNNLYAAYKDDPVKSLSVDDVFQIISFICENIEKIEEIDVPGTEFCGEFAPLAEQFGTFIANPNSESVSRPAVLRSAITKTLGLFSTKSAFIFLDKYGLDNAFAYIPNAELYINDTYELENRLCRGRAENDSEIPCFVFYDGVWEYYDNYLPDSAPNVVGEF